MAAGWDADVDPTPEQTPQPSPPQPSPLLRLRESLPDVVDTPDALDRACAALAGGTGPVAIDAERASGYRYSQRAYLIQLRREGAGTSLIDPVAFASLDPLVQALEGTEWILHAATQDLPCLAEVGLRPARLFDTELAGRLLGYPKVGLATLVEELLGLRLRKEHSAADWSTRPLPKPWLEYAALDVEALAELRTVLGERLQSAGKQEWADQEFTWLLGFTPAVRGEPWRRTSGAHRVRGRRQSAAVRELWLARDRLARDLDVAPGRLLPDSAIVAAAQAMPTDRSSLLATSGFHGRGARRHVGDWLGAVREARTMAEEDLPQRAPRSDEPPVPRAWAERDPLAAERLRLARLQLTATAEAHELPVENMLTPDHARRVLWSPPDAAAADLTDRVAQRLSDLGSRPWQIDLTAPLLAKAIAEAKV